MSSNTIALDAVLSAAPEAVLEHLMQPENYKGLQPFVASVDTLEQGFTQAGHAFVHYRAVEQVPLLAGLRLHTPLDVISTLTEPAQQMVSVVRSSAAVRVTFVYDVQQVDASTHLKLHITADASRWLIGYILSRARQAQTVVLGNLKQRLENASHV